ncbi:MAG: efflux RND transporter periplasmic adaptor subunit [Polaromonas sp.]
MPSWAGEGHDHGEAAPTAAGAASPRVNSSSDLFELVGVVERGEMVIYLDRFATNTPVTDAKIEVDVGTAKGLAEAQPDGTYHFNHAALGQAGTVPVSFTVTAGADTDLLAGDLAIGEAPHDDAANAVARPWWQWAGLAVAAALVLGALAAWAKRRRRQKASGRFASVLIAACATIAWASASFDAQAGEGHDHGEAAPAATGNGPRRLPDGSVFLPKTSQRQLAVRTVVAEVKSLPKTIELGGVVTMDPNAGGRVQPTIAGRLEAGPRGLPQLGQAVRKGEVLAFVRASANPIERGNQLAQTAELKARLQLAEKRAMRLAQLEGTVAQKDQDEAKADVSSLQQRLAAVSASVSAGEALTAPVTGVIASAKAVSGQVVEARDVLFEITDPARLQVQASGFDAALGANIASASVAAGSTTVALTFVGAGLALQEGAIPLQFKAQGTAALPLAVNQSVKVVVQTKELVQGVAVPAAALVKTTSNQDMVWVHTGPEAFAPRTVRFMALDGATVSVTDGLKPGDRVVTQGAALLNQVR